MLPLPKAYRLTRSCLFIRERTVLKLTAVRTGPSRTPTAGMPAGRSEPRARDAVLLQAICIVGAAHQLPSAAPGRLIDWVETVSSLPSFQIEPDSAVRYREKKKLPLKDSYLSGIPPNRDNVPPVSRQQRCRPSGWRRGAAGGVMWGGVTCSAVEWGGATPAIRTKIVQTVKNVAHHLHASQTGECANRRKRQPRTDDNDNAYL
jgi:hypothetical protein